MSNDRMREEFEAWAVSEGYARDCMISGHYICAVTSAAWDAWKASRAAAPEVEHETVADALHARAMGLYRPPFRYDSFGGYIWDSENNMVADNHDLQDDAVLRIRGWGRISYMDDPEALQDKMGELVSAALTAYWTQPTDQKPELAAPAVQGEPVGWRSRFLKLMGEMQSELDDSNDDPIPSELWSLWRELLDSAPQPAEQQPAPDVAGLVEALEWLRGAINCTPENDKHQSGAWIGTKHPRIRQIDELLAAHRKGGEA